MQRSSLALSAKSILAGIGFGVALLGAGAAQAQDTDGKPDHFRIEARGGWDHLSIPDQTGSTNSTNTGTQRGLYGIGIGYDRHMGNHVVVGVESNLMFQGGHSSCQWDVVAAGDQLCGRLRHDWDIGGRLGYQAHKALIYTRLAYARTSVSTNYADADGNFVASRGHTDGVRVGAGVEYALRGPLYVKAEYTWTGSNYANQPVQYSSKDQQQLLGGIGLRF